LIKDDNALLDLWRFDHGMPLIFERTRRRVQAFYRGAEDIKKASAPRKAGIRAATATLNLARKNGTAPPAKKRDRLAILGRALKARGLIVDG
jgi:hypothetical protein